MSSLAPTPTDMVLALTLMLVTPPMDNGSIMTNSTNGVTIMTVKIVPSQLVTMLTPSHTTLVILTIITTVLIVHTHGIAKIAMICQLILLDTRMTGDSHFVWVVVFMRQLVGLTMKIHSRRSVVLPTLVITTSTQTFFQIK